MAGRGAARSVPAEYTLNAPRTPVLFLPDLRLLSTCPGPHRDAHFPIDGKARNTADRSRSLSAPSHFPRLSPGSMPVDVNIPKRRPDGDTRFCVFLMPLALLQCAFADVEHLGGLIVLQQQRDVIPLRHTCAA